ncbi:YDR514C [Saccharomyces arboricola H-6]|uniref:YDR514C n=1 Tax=Saccharomyces arboricola (strain H-6 / AS 2.3317 / CBS 10644) TaxID=1160507 RepID=J8Q3G9_SACAR|nr:YDR514C [Saccharomyces arboricola H-6]
MNIFTKYMNVYKAVGKMNTHRFNSKAVRNYHQPQGFNKSLTALNAAKVRGMIPSRREGVGSYKSSSNKLNNKLGKHKTWINEFEHFNSLHKITYSPNDVLSDEIKKYLTLLTKNYQLMYKESTESLDKKLEAVDKEWTEKIGRIPKASKDDEEKILRKQYLANVNDVKNEHIPMMSYEPDSFQFTYLCNTIELLSSNKTICFAIDVEAFEFDTDIVTEIGISIYDPRENIHSLTPIIRSYHLIVAEALPLRNKKFVCDFKDCFLLGESLVLPLEQCVEFIQSLINFYMKCETEQDSSWERAFIGHSISGDIRWLKKIGVRIPELDNELGTPEKLVKGKCPQKHAKMFDTEKIYSICYGKKGSSLGKLLRLCHMPHAFLHNAGNDAYYTLNLMLKLGDFNFRKQIGADDLETMGHRIREWFKREKDEPKILPMSYVLSVMNANNGKPKVNDNGRKKPRDLVPQTEFSGSQWFQNAKAAFKSTLV